MGAGQMSGSMLRRVRITGKLPSLFWMNCCWSDSNSFINRISNSHQEDQPDEFYGGIIADAMGLGKTLTMIALISSDAERASSSPSFGSDASSASAPARATLIIVPPPCKLKIYRKLHAHRSFGADNSHSSTRYVGGATSRVSRTYSLVVAVKPKTGYI